MFARVSGRELQVHGSGDLAGTLMQHDLIDEYRLLIYPVALGNGRRLFADGTKPAALRLIDSNTTSTGVTVNVYEPAGEPTYGSFELEG
jgi:dihydrofolate reductase